MSEEVDRFKKEFLTKHSSATIKAYERDVTDFLAYNNGRITSLEHVQERVIQYFRDNEQYARSTVERKVASLTSFFRFVHNTKDQIIKIDEVLPVIETKPNRDGKIVTPEQYSKIINTIRSKESKIHRVFIARDIVTFNLLYFGGLSASSLGKLNSTDYQVEQIDGNLTIRLNHIGNIESVNLKKENGIESKDYLELREDFLKMKETTEEALFLNKNAKRLSDRSIRRHLELYCKNAGIPEANIYDLRRSTLIGAE